MPKLVFKRAMNFFILAAALTIIATIITYIINPDVNGVMEGLSNRSPDQIKESTDLDKVWAYVVNNGFMVPLQMFILALIPIQFLYAINMISTVILTGVAYGLVLQLDFRKGFEVMISSTPHVIFEVFAYCILAAVLFELNQVVRVKLKSLFKKDNKPEEFYDLIDIFNKYPMEELIIHPRIQKDFYKNKPNLTIFREALRMSKNPVCYNGDIFTVKDYEETIASFPSVDKLMLGRGLIANPGLIRDIKNNINLEKGLLKDFHDRVYGDYKKILFGDRNVLFKMKDLWSYMISLFSNNEKYAKKIKKSERLYDYDEAVSSLFREQDILIK